MGKFSKISQVEVEVKCIHCDKAFEKDEPSWFENDEHTCDNCALTK